jgi:hypothetical protein
MCITDTRKFHVCSDYLASTYVCHKKFKKSRSIKDPALLFFRSLHVTKPLGRHSTGAFSLMGLKPHRIVLWGHLMQYSSSDSIDKYIRPTIGLAKVRLRHRVHRQCVRGKWAVITNRRCHRSQYHHFLRMTCLPLAAFLPHTLLFSCMGEYVYASDMR